MVIAVQAAELLRQRQVILPALNVIDRACAEAITTATRRIYKTLIEPLTAAHKQHVDDLLKVKQGKWYYFVGVVASVASQA